MKKIHYHARAFYIWYVNRQATGSLMSAQVMFVLQLEFVLADAMRDYFEALFADRMHDGYLQLTDQDIADIRRNHRAQIAA
jgi:hypothetical protein